MPNSPEFMRDLGKRLGGRKKGSLTKEQREKRKVSMAVNRRILRMADKLVRSHAITAMGTHRMVVVSVDEEGKKHIETVRDEKRMDKMLEEGVYGQDYLILEGTPADWRAAEALLNRPLGKPKESLELDVDVKFSLRDLLQSRGMLNGNGDQELLPAPVKIIEADESQSNAS